MKEELKKQFKTIMKEHYFTKNDPELPYDNILSCMEDAYNLYRPTPSLADTETIYEMWQQGQSQYPVQSEVEERVYYKSLTTQAERIAYIKGTKFGSQWKQDQSGWIEAWTPPNDSRYVRVLVDGKHNIHPHFYMAGEWFDNLGAFPVDLKISHWKDFDDLAPESK